MNNDEYFEQLEKRKVELMKLREYGIKLTKEMVGKTLMEEDLYICASADRCMNLIDGMIGMLDTRNLTCAGALLRLQMDNCLRSYALFIACDRIAVFNCLIDGKQIDKQKVKMASS